MFDFNRFGIGRDHRHRIHVELGCPQLTAIFTASLAGPHHGSPIGGERRQTVEAHRMRDPPQAGAVAHRIVAVAGVRVDEEDLVVVVSDLARRIDHRLAVTRPERTPVDVLVAGHLMLLRDTGDGTGVVELEVRHEDLQQVVINKISVVIPVFNEQGNIGKLINEIESVLKNKIVYEIVVVNDGSYDQTYDILKKICKNKKNILVITHKKNYGQSVGLYSGILHARHDFIVTLDGDGQNDPKDIIKLIKKYDENIDFMMVIGNRVNRIDSNSRKIASRLAFKIRKILLKDNTPDTGCALKLFRKKDFLQLPFFNHMHRFLPFLYKAFKGNVISITVNHRTRASGISKYSNFQRFLVGIYDILGVLWIRKRSVWPINIEKINNIKKIRRFKNGN